MLPLSWGETCEQFSNSGQVICIQYFTLKTSDRNEELMMLHTSLKEWVQKTQTNTIPNTENITLHNLTSTHDHKHSRPASSSDDRSTDDFLHHWLSVGYILLRIQFFYGTWYCPFNTLNYNICCNINKHSAYISLLRSANVLKYYFRVTLAGKDHNTGTRCLGGYFICYLLNEH